MDNAILDGEIVCLDDAGRSLFYDLMFHRGEPYLYAFDLVYLVEVALCRPNSRPPDLEPRG